METKQIRYEIYLNHLTLSERLSNRADFNEYKETVISMLKCRDKFLYEDTILQVLALELRENGSIEPLTMEEVEAAYPGRFVKDDNETDESFKGVWYDLLAIESLESSNELFYDIFFVYKLRSVNLFEIDAFLKYQLAKQGNNLDGFTRFVQLALRKHATGRLSHSHIQTVTESLAKQHREIPGTLNTVESISVKTRGKYKREYDDKLTKLNQEQTALLIHCLQKGRIIFKDEYLSNKEAGQAFAMLTGYSPDTLRQNLGKADLSRIVTKKNVRALHDALTNLTIQIGNEMKPEK
jgi:hypothetical protein